MIGQAELQNKLNAYSLSDFPQSVLIEGEFGSGKHLLVKELANNFFVDVENITENLNYEYISTLFLRTTPMFYLVDGTDLSVKSQNALLKFLEEPPVVAKVFVLCENKNTLLETIQNRCFCVKMQPYTSKELSEFSDDTLLTTYARTPGQILEFKKVNFSDIVNLCDTILLKIDNANIPNILTLSSKFNFGKEPTKFNINLFCSVLLDKAFHYSVDNQDSKYYKAYCKINELCKRLSISNVDKKKLFEHELLELKFVLK